MKALAVAIALTLTGCAAQPIPTAPIADRTQLDEKALGLAYAAATLATNAMEGAAKAGMLTPAQATELQNIRANMAFALKGAQAAYDIGNSSSFLVQIAQVNTLAGQAAKLTGGRQ